MTIIYPYVNSLDPDETPGYSESHPDPSYLTLKQQFHQVWTTFEIIWKLKQTRNEADDNFTCRIRVNSAYAADGIAESDNKQCWSRSHDGLLIVRGRSNNSLPYSIMSSSKSNWMMTLESFSTWVETDGEYCNNWKVYHCPAYHNQIAISKQLGSWWDAE